MHLRQWVAQAWHGRFCHFCTSTIIIARYLHFSFFFSWSFWWDEATNFLTRLNWTYCYKISWCDHWGLMHIFWTTFMCHLQILSSVVLNLYSTVSRWSKPRGHRHFKRAWELQVLSSFVNITGMHEIRTIICICYCIIRVQMFLELRTEICHQRK